MPSSSYATNAPPAFRLVAPGNNRVRLFWDTTNILDYYTVSMESQKSWMVFNASSKIQVEEYLSKSPLYKYWVIEIDELFVYDGQSYRLPAVQLN